MDFLKLIRSFEDLLFEVLTWLIYYPRTLGLVLRRPLRMAAYVDHEERLGQAVVEGAGAAGIDPLDRYPDTLSPPLTLLLTVVLAHGAELATEAPHPLVGTAAAELLLGSDQNLILLRSLLFGLLPLMAALRVVRVRGLSLERRHLRAPFFGQCYLAAVLAGTLDGAALLGRANLPGIGWAAGGAAVLGALWYVRAQVRLFEQALGVSRGRSIWLTARALGSALLYVLVVVLALALDLSGTPSA